MKCSECSFYIEEKYENQINGWCALRGKQTYGHLCCSNYADREDRIQDATKTYGVKTQTKSEKGNKRQGKQILRVVIVTLLLIMLAVVLPVISSVRKEFGYKGPRVIGNLDSSEYSLYIGERITLSLTLLPRDATNDDVFADLNGDCIKIENFNVVASEYNALLTFDCVAVKSGEASLRIMASDRLICSNTSIFRVSQKPEIEGFKLLQDDPVCAEVDDVLTLGCKLYPADITPENIIVSSSDEEVASVVGIRTTAESDCVLLEAEIRCLRTGNCTLIISGSDELSRQETVLNISEKDTSPIVYITKTGKRYHFSAGCAGDGRIESTVKKAEAKGKTPCARCAK